VTADAEKEICPDRVRTDLRAGHDRGLASVKKGREQKTARQTKGNPPTGVKSRGPRMEVNDRVSRTPKQKLKEKGDTTSLPKKVSWEAYCFASAGVRKPDTKANH